MSKNYKDANRIIIFRDLTYDEMKREIDEKKFDAILLDRYSEFISLCEEVEANAESVESVSCEYVNNELEFSVKYKE